MNVCEVLCSCRFMNCLERFYKIYVNYPTWNRKTSPALLSDQKLQYLSLSLSLSLFFLFFFLKCVHYPDGFCISQLVRGCTKCICNDPIIFCVLLIRAIRVDDVDFYCKFTISLSAFFSFNIRKQV